MIAKRAGKSWIVSLALLGLSVARLAGAQGSARSLDIDASIRASGMGGASNAVFWGGDPNDWANPALLAYQSGIRFTQGRTNLVPGLANDVTFDTRRLTISGQGIGIALPGDPNGYGTTRLNYGQSLGTDDQGRPIGTFGSFEDIRSWGVGVSLAGMVTAISRHAGVGTPAFLKYGDFAIGLNDKHVVVSLFPGAEAETDARDYGYILRATPIDGLGTEDEPGWPLRVDVAYAHSVLNYNDGLLVFINEDQASPTTRMRRDGVGVRVAYGMPPGLRSSLADTWSWLPASLTPLVSVGFASDREHNQAGDTRSGRYDVDRWGVELAIANVITLRTGHVTDKLGDIDGDTFGWGLGFRVAEVAGFRYDHGEIPQARNSGLRDVERRGFTAFVDPFQLAARLGKAN